MDVFELPEGLSEIKRVDLQKDKRTAVFINLGAAAIMIVLLVLGMFIVPPDFEIFAGNFGVFLLQAAGVLVAILIYTVLHELVHGIFIKIYSGKKAKFGFTGLYAYAGSEAYFCKKHYIVIALAPVLLFGVAFLALNIFLPKEWFWSIYFLQITNLAGAAGDIYITALMGRLPADVLVKDSGVTMVIYSKR